MHNIRDWQLDFGPVCSGAGTVTTISHKPQCNFRVRKVFANDSATPPGTGTRVQQILVGNQLQRPAATDTLSLFFATGALGNEVTWVCDRASIIAITVSFIQACTFDMSCFGSAWE